MRVMKNTLRSFLLLMAFAGSAVVCFGQAPKIAIVDMAYLFDNHYKTVAQNAALKGEQDRIKADIERLQREGQALQNEYTVTTEQLKNPGLTPDAKAKLEEKQRAKMEELQRKGNEYNALQRDSNDSINRRIMSFRTLLLEEISEVAITVAKRQGYTMVFDKSSPLIYGDESMNITQAVLAEINKTKPATTTP